jgi:hypothetical protein
MVSLPASPKMASERADPISVSSNAEPQRTETLTSVSVPQPVAIPVPRLAVTAAGELS